MSDSTNNGGPAPPPVAIVCIGMAGSGKTTFVRRINAYLNGQKDPPYVINLDPAVLKTPFGCNIDIRDSVNYHQVMKQYGLGPNGGILTALNLFATKIDQVMSLLEKRAQPDPQNPERVPIQKIVVDTPGQIEAFVWSASGTILLDSLASSFPTVIAYVIDTPRTRSTSTFMSNMLYACSILYKTKLPMILVFNKTDVQDAAFATEWMSDLDAFQAALRQDESTDAIGGWETSEAAGVGSGYMGSLLHSMSLMLEEFYVHLNVVAVSSRVGTGIDDFFTAVAGKVEEFNRDYLPELQRQRKNREEAKRKGREKELDRLMKGMAVGASSSGQADGEAGADLDTDSTDFSDEDSAGEDDGKGEDKSKGHRPGGVQLRDQSAPLASEDSVATEASFAKYLHHQQQQQQ